MDCETLRVNINDIPTTGAGPGTSGQLWNSNKRGVKASHALAAEDEERMGKLKKCICDAAKETGIDPAVIAAIISRETRAKFLKPDGWNKGRVAYGLMQVHKDNNPNEEGIIEHMIQAAGLLKGFIEQFQQQRRFWSPELQFKAGLAAYNCGPEKVTSEKVDENTEEGDYANDVVARAQWYKSNGY